MANERRLGFIITAKDQATAALAKLRGSIEKLGDEGKKTEKKLKDVEKAASGFDTIGGGIDRMVTALAGLDFASKILEQINAARDFADSLNDMSERTGIAVERLSELAYAGQLSDVSIESMQTGLKGLSKKMAEAAGGSEKAREAFSLMGIDPSGKSTDEVLLEIAEAFSGYEDGANKSALAMQIFGKAGVDMIPFLNNGKEGIADLSKEARQLGGVVSTDTAKAAADFNDNLDKMATALRGVFLDTLVDTHSPLGSFIQDLVDATTETGNLIDSLIMLGKNKLELNGLTVQDQIKELNGKIKSREFTRDSIYKNNPDGRDTVNAEIAGYTMRRNALEAILKKQDERAKQKNNPQPQGGAGGTTKTNAPVVTVGGDAEAKAAASAAAREAAESERARATLAKAQADSVTSARIAAVKRQEVAIKQLLDDGVISYAEYYASQIELQQTAIDARLEALRKEREEQDKLSRSSKAKESERIKAMAEVVKLDSEILNLQKEREATAPDAARLQSKAEEELADKLRDVQLRTAELLGMASPEQRRAAIDGQYQDLRARAVSNYGEGSDAVNSVDKARTTEAAKSIFDDLMDNVSRSKSRADGSRQRVDVMEKSGLIGTREAELRRMAIDQELMRNTAEYIPLLQKQADLLGGDAVTAIEALETQVLELREAVDPQIQKLADAAGSAVTGVLDGLRDGSLKSASDVAKFFLKTLEDSIIREGTQELSKIVSGLFKDLFSSAASSIGGGGGMDLGGLASGAGGFLDSLIGSFVGFSSGGYTGGAGVSAPAGVVHGQEYVMSAPAVRTLGVGFLDALHSTARRGAPRVSLPGYANGGYVQSGSRGGSSGVTVVQNIQTPDADSFRRSQGQLEARTGVAVQRAVRKFK